MLEEIEFPHAVEGTLQVMLWFHLYPNECKDRMEIFLKIGGLNYKLIGEVSDMVSGTTSVFLAEHSYGEDGNHLRIGVTSEFKMAISDLNKRGVAFQTSAYSMAPYLFTAYRWSLEVVK